MKEYIKLTVQGMAIGSLILIILSIFGIYFGGKEFQELLVNNFITYSIAAMVIGIGFSLPSIVYENNELSLLKQFLIQMSIGMSILIITSLFVGWIPINYGLGIIIWISIALTFTILIWAGFYLYNKKEASNINKQIKKIQNKN